MAASNIPIPEPFTQGSDWDNFEETFNIYALATELDKKAPEVQVATLKAIMGKEANAALKHIPLTNDEKKSTVAILTKLGAHFKPKTNVVFERYKFNTCSQGKDEPIETYVARLRKLADTCNYGDLLSDMLRDRIILGCKDDKSRARLFREENLTLDKAVQVFQTSELADAQLNTILKTAEQIHSVKTRSDPKPKSKPPVASTGQHTAKRCLFCNKLHVFRKELCPAYGKVCRVCNGKNHFPSSTKCPKKKTSSVHTLSTPDTDTDTSEGYWVGSLKSNGKRVFAMMEVNSIPVCFRLDGGAEINIITDDLVSPSDIRPTHRLLESFHHTTSTPVGEADLEIVNPKTNATHSVHFAVVPKGYMCLLGQETIEEMNLVTVNTENFIVANLQVSDIMEKYPTVFDGGLGKLPGSVKLHLKPDSQPKVLPARRIPFAIQDEVKKELDRLVDLGILAPVEGPTEWVNQMAVGRKKGGALRICIDPAPLNEALMREHHHLPVIEDVLDKFSGAKVFSKLDVASAYWHLELEKESSLLTCMATPWGRFQWKVLPFGLCVSSEIFARHISQALDGLPSVYCIADDIAVLSKGDTEHDADLDSLLQRCSEKGIKLNKSSDKLQIRCKEMTLHGNVFTAQGIKPDPLKVKAISDMPQPQDVTAVRRFCGLVQYLSRFLPHLATIASPLRELTHNNITWNWTDIHTEAFQAIKRMTCEAPLLVHYNPQAPLVLQTDASSYGLGAVLLQNGVPVAYASRSLTQTESRYAQIEKELLSVVYGLERFDQYTYGRPVSIENDHSPLATLAKKPLKNIPKRLQAMMMRMHRYDYTLIYKPGKYMVLPDTLSRAPLSESPETDQFNVNSVSFLPISATRLEEIRSATEKDKTLQSLRDVIMSGWPEHRSLVLPEISAYYTYRDELTIQDGIILRGERVVIPMSLRSDIKNRLHAGHLGINSCLRRARELIYWPGMSSEIRQYIEACHVCCTFSDGQSQEPLIVSEVPSRPWAKVGTDIFTLQGRNYLVTVDYFSTFFEVDYLPETTSDVVVHKLKHHFARHGVPDEVRSDGGPQYTSADFKTFAREWNFVHKISSPGNSKSNGAAEAAVKTAKRIMKKSFAAKEDPYIGLLNHRNTPTEGVGTSPAQRLFGRRTKTLLPTTAEQLKPQGYSDSAIRMEEKKAKVASRYVHRKELQPISPGTTVMMKPVTPFAKEWREGVVTKPLSPRTYEVQTPDGKHLRRNRRLLRPIPKTPTTVSIDNTHDALPSSASLKPVPSTPAKTPQCDTSVTSDICDSPKKTVPESPKQDVRESPDSDSACTKTRSGRIVRKTQRLDL